MAISRAQLLKELLPGLNALFGLEYARYGEEHKEIYETETSERSFEEETKLSGFSAAPVKNEGSAIAYDNAQEAWTARYNHETIALGFSLTEEAIEDNLYDSLSARYTKALARAMAYTKQVKAASVLNNGFNAAYTGGDGVSLCSTAHPNTAGGTWSNKPTVDVDLSEAALEDAVVAIMGLQNDRGLLVAIQPNSLHIARQEIFNAQRILHSSYQTGNANNDINVIKSGNYIPGGFKVNHYFTSPHAWFIRNTIPGGTGMKYYERHAIAFDQDNDFDTMNVKAKGYERYSFGWSDPRAVWGSNGP